MQIRIRETGNVVTGQEFRAMFPNTGFPVQLTEAIINDFGGDVVFEGPQAQPTRYQVAFRDGVEQIGGKWYTKNSVADMEQEAKDALDAQQANSQRAFRNTLLADCDWTQLQDAPVNQQAWANYRQALRDVTAQAGFPWTVEWPTKPE
ncbi:Phage tail assembly chaperone protein [uncultured Caudovirales phage]|uniref:Phage tail assembly chaperone protein n=1 Tax=uncultured Caudovirales phage TaxID=2100421 RepID=A0A6J5LRX5_9CAUD|nr:Phage tail assembly chaperone protein [uncultured Caudovirales phage]